MKELPRYLREKKSVSKEGRDQEEIARKHINSGAVWFDAFDLNTKDLLIDVKKVITQKQITFHIDKIKKLFDKAMDENKTPVYLTYINNFVLKTVIERNPEGRIIK